MALPPHDPVPAAVTSRRWRWTAAGVALGVVGVGCGSGGQAQPLPIDVLLSGSGAVSEQVFQSAVQNEIAACMKQRGWEYIPIPIPDRGNPAPVDLDAFRAEWGYGITTMLEPDGTSVQVLDGSLGFVNPNGPITEALSADDRAAYMEDLYGLAEEAASTSDDRSGDVGTPCTTVGFDAANASLDLPDPEFVERVVGAFGERFDADPRVRAVWDEWAECMRAAGHGGFDGPLEVTAYLEDALEPLLSQEEMVGLADLQAEEMELAAADHACQKRYVTEVLLDVRVELVEGFVAEHPEWFEPRAPAGG